MASGFLGSEKAVMSNKKNKTMIIFGTSSLAWKSTTSKLQKIPFLQMAPLINLLKQKHLHEGITFNFIFAFPICFPIPIIFPET